MAVVSFNPLEYAEQLEAAGMPRDQAQVVAKGLTTMFIHNFDELVTKDYLDTRFSEFESKMDLRFAETDGKLKDMESRMDLRFAGIETRFARVNVILGILLVGIIIPNLQAVLTWMR
jgi:hypothetical protein